MGLHRVRNRFELAENRLEPRHDRCGRADALAARTDRIPPGPQGYSVFEG
ncbi:hypothetical protein [Haladaptatus salinisoli]|nr:hypothetical protein [Haladaptatus salinisoli]